MLGNYEDGNNFQYDGAIRDLHAPSSYACSEHPLHEVKTDPSIQSSSSNESSKQGHSSHGSPRPSKKFPNPGNSISIQSKGTPVKSHQTKMDSWSDVRDYATLPSVLPDLSPPAEPLSPLHSSNSSESERDMDEDNHATQNSLPPQCKSSSRRTASTHHSEPQQKEASHLGGDAPISASQSFPLPLCSKPNLANSRKPMALVRPLDGPDQVSSESPDLKPSPDDYHGQTYENLSDLKNVAKATLPPLKIPLQSVEVSLFHFFCKIALLVVLLAYLFDFVVTAWLWLLKRWSAAEECQVCMIFQAQLFQSTFPFSLVRSC